MSEHAKGKIAGESEYVLALQGVVGQEVSDLEGEEVRKFFRKALRHAGTTKADGRCSGSGAQSEESVS